MSSPVHVLLAALLGLIPLPAAGAATDYPARPIRFLVPSAPGGTPDIIARVVGTELGRQMGQSVVVDTRPGANGTIGMQLLAKSPADGYTIGYAPVSALAINPAIRPDLPYDANRDGPGLRSTDWAG